MTLVLAANGLVTGKRLEGTPKIRKWLHANGVGSVAYINWAMEGLSLETRQENASALRQLQEELGEWNVIALSLADSLEDLKFHLEEVDAVYINGGNPAVLANVLGRTGMDDLLRRFHAQGKHIIGASSGAIVLGSGRVWLTALFAEFPKGGLCYWLPGLLGKGLGLIPQAVVPHRQSLPPILQRIFKWCVGAKELIIVADDTYKVVG